MLFPTLNFLIFFVVVFAVSWSLINRMAWRKYFLIGASYFFYGYWDWRFTGLLFLSTVINYVGARVVAATDRVRVRKAAVAVAVALDLGILGFFKYYDFFLESLDDLLHRIGWQRDLPFLEIILPVGISFFTFQGISYVVDVYRAKIEVRRSLADVMLYISFFPQLVAGPIVRASDFIPQLDRRPEPNRVLVGMGMLLIVWGLFKKQILATYIALDLADKAFFDPARYGAVDLILGVWGYAVQIYCDFSAYSDIAIGVAALLGYTFPRNFDQPYRAVSLSDFWRRWHISLSSWLRDYLYIPLGGNRKGPVRTYVNLMLTMLLGGLWHGAAWKFVAWGGLHGAGLAVERALGGAGRVVGWTRSHILSVVLVFNFVCLAWIFFRARTLGDAITYISGLANWSAPIVLATPLNLILIALGLIINLAPRDTLEWAETGFWRSPLVVRALFCALFVVVVDAFGLDGAAPFIYFQF